MKRVVVNEDRERTLRRQVMRRMVDDVLQFCKLSGAQ
jgi:hypothetical protein